MRSRNIKPGFFKNEDLGQCKFEERILFISLWCMADREGFFENRPAKIAVESFPYDKKIDVDHIKNMLCNLMSLHLITLHEMYGYIPNFLKHQNPHPHEAKSTVPIDIQNILKNQCHCEPCNVMKCNADILNPDILNPDIINTNKDIYGEFKNVKLTLEEYGKLIKKFGIQTTKEKIESLSTGIASKGYKYKSHYATILTWDRKNSQPQQQTQNPINWRPL